MDETAFRYSAACWAPDCPERPLYKIAAPWSHGPLRELKSYGLACPGHRDALLAHAESHRETLALRDDEFVGPVEVFPLATTDAP